MTGNWKFLDLWFLNNFHHTKGPYCCCCYRVSHVRLCATPEMAAHQAPSSLGFSRQEHWSGLPFPSPMHESEKWKWSHSVMSDWSQPHGRQPTRLLHPWDFPGKSTGVGCHCLLQILTLDGQNSTWTWCTDNTYWSQFHSSLTFSWSEIKCLLSYP